MTSRGQIIVALGGVAATASAAGALRMPAREAVEIAAVAAGSAIAAGLVGAASLRMLRRRSLGTQSAVVALTAIAAVGAGAWGTASAMFLSKHDLHALIVVLAAATTVGMVVALALGSRVGAASTALAEAADRIGSGELGAPIRGPATGEFAGLARRLEEMSARLDEARGNERAMDSSRRELIAWVSHDLRTPLAGIRAMAEALADGVVDDLDTVARYHRTIRFETERLASLVDDLFELSRIQAGALRLQRERVSLGDLVSDALASADPIARSKGVRLEGRLASEPPRLELAAPEFGRVLRNLISNAIRHTPSDGTVFVEAGADESSAYVAVGDGCGGIPDTDMDRIFEVAFRGEAARTPASDAGAGLGLAIARGLVEAHHGEIDVANDGPGCRFTVRVPLATPA